MDQTKVPLTIALLTLAITMVFSRIPVGIALMLWPWFPKWRWPGAELIMNAVGLVTVSGFVVAAVVCVMWGGLDSILLVILVLLALIFTPLLL